MRITANEFISLDGVVQAPGGPEEDTDGGFANGGWSHAYFDVDLMGPFIDATLTQATDLLFGRRTWRVMADAWPGRAGDPFADKMNAIHKYVVSSTLAADDTEWNSTVVPGATAMDELRKLKESGEGEALVMGSPSLVRALIADELLDELRLMVMPVLLGGGKGVFPADGKLRGLELVSSVSGDTGTTIAVYRPTGQ